MLPWFLCAHMLGDCGRPFKQAVDEIICALWAMRWHHKHCALSCPLRRVMLVIFLKSVKVRPASLTQVNCSGSYWMLPWIHLPSKRWWWAAILTNAKWVFFVLFFFYNVHHFINCSMSPVWITIQNRAVISIHAVTSCVSGGNIEMWQSAMPKYLQTRQKK